MIWETSISHRSPFCWVNIYMGMLKESYVPKKYRGPTKWTPLILPEWSRSVLKDFIPEKAFLKASEWHLDTDRRHCLSCPSLFTCDNRRWYIALCFLQAAELSLAMCGPGRLTAGLGFRHTPKAARERKRSGGAVLTTAIQMHWEGHGDINLALDLAMDDLSLMGFTE